MIIAPVKKFLVDFKINNPSDLDTHYVRAVIKNAISGAVIATLNLTDNGSGYFSKEWMTPNDPTGNGLQVSVMTTVYDDSGYTSESLVYGSTLERYIIRDLASPRLGIGGAGSGMREGVDYKQLEKIVRKVVSELVKFPEIKFPEQILPEVYNDSKLVESLGRIQKMIPPPSVDRADEVIKKILNSKEIKAVEELPGKFEQAEVSDTRLHERLDKFLEDQESKDKEFKDSLGKILKGMAVDMEEFNDKVDEIMSKPVNVTFNTRAESDKREKLKEEAIDGKRKRSIEQLINGY